MAIHSSSKSTSRNSFYDKTSFQLLRICLQAFICMVLILNGPVFIAQAADSRPITDSGFWPQYDSEQKPWTRWWWMGNAVTKDGITRHLEQMAEIHIGGVEISPIYGVEGYEEDSVEYLSPEWIQLLNHTVMEAERLGMKVDMINGSGWPFGGSHVSREHASRQLSMRTYSLHSNEPFEHRIQQVNRRMGAAADLQLLKAYSEDGESKDLTVLVEPNGRLNWTPPENSGKWKLVALFNDWTSQIVKRPAPGEDHGYVVDHFSRAALQQYLSRFEDAFSTTGDGLLRAFFNDSFEAYQANWTRDFFDYFKKKRNYDLRNYLHLVAGIHLPEASISASRPDGLSDKDKLQRLKADFHQTLHDLLLNEFLKPWVEWTHSMGSSARNQAHGSPGNLLDLYGIADIPETEIFGQRSFQIPGLRNNRDLIYKTDSPDPLVLKFASSAAHTQGRKLASSETATWLDEHFMVSLSQIHPHIDMQFVSGINHTVYHGSTYSPQEESWPGWKFYASTHFAPSNTFWEDLGELNRYISINQAFLQQTGPGNDILLYFPIQDLWHQDLRNFGTPYYLRVHNPDNWMHHTPFGDLADWLWNRGYTFDYISDQQLLNVQVRSTEIHTGNTSYRTIVVPEVRFMPLETIETLVEMAHAGATVIFSRALPYSISGLYEFETRMDELKKIYASLNFEPSQSGILQARAGKGKILVGDSMNKILTAIDIHAEGAKEAGLDFIRRTHPDGYLYFMTNLGSQDVDQWIRVEGPIQSAVIADAIARQKGRAQIRQNSDGEYEVFLQIPSGRSLIVKTFHRHTIAMDNWLYSRETDRGISIDGPWEIRFLQGGPEIPEPITVLALDSWTRLGTGNTRYFSGSASYSTTFEMKQKPQHPWRLHLGQVGESARVWLNNEYIGTIWSHPFFIDLPQDRIQSGENRLEVEVTNLMINRIIHLDKHSVRWQKFYDINMVNIHYRPFDASGWEPMNSGLMGPVLLVPLEVSADR